MGKSYTPKYVVEVYYANERLRNEFPAEWRVRSRGQLKGYGAPTPDNLCDYVTKFNESMHPGGCNEHLAKAVGGYVVAAEIRYNGPNGAPVARYAQSGFNLARFIP